MVSEVSKWRKFSTSTAAAGRWLALGSADAEEREPRLPGAVRASARVEWLGITGFLSGSGSWWFR